MQHLLLFPVRRLGARLFGVNALGQIWWINNHESLDAYFIDNGVGVTFFPKVAKYTKKMYFEWLQSNADSVDEIVDMPHFPDSLPGVFYMPNKIPDQPYSGKLDELIDFFNPMTKYDRDLIKAMFITPFGRVKVVHGLPLL